MIQNQLIIELCTASNLQINFTTYTVLKSHILHAGTTGRREFCHYIGCTNIVLFSREKKPLKILESTLEG